MNHPYNGAASYIYVNEHDSGDHSKWQDTQNPYSHMRNLMPMHSLVPPQQQLHQDRLSRESNMSMWSGEYGSIRSSLSARRRSRAVAWRGTIKRHVRKAFNNVGGLFKLRPPWIMKARFPISGVH